jgi:hypothetical protein
MHVVRLALVVTLGALATGCDGKSKRNRATPSPPAAATVIISIISGNDAVLTGVSTTFTVTATLSDGTTRAVTPTWTSSNTDVASVDSSGRLEGRAHGTTTLTATHDGISATKSVQVVNDYRGTWIGRFVVNRCDAPSGICNSEWDVFSFPVHLEVSQTGIDHSEIRAVLILPIHLQIHANISGRVTSDGRLNLAGSSEVPGNRGRIWATFHVGAWDTTLSGRGMMTGRWTQRLSNLQPPYNYIMENELETMTRTSSTAGPVSGLP